MTAARPRSLLAAEHIAMIAKGVSTIVASRNDANRPSLMRAVGCTVTPDGKRLTVFVARKQSRQLLQDIAATGAIAVVFSEPLSHRTVQMKAREALLRDAVEDDRPALDRYLQSMKQEVGAVGFGSAFVQAMLAAELDDLVAIAFSPTEAFDQTPGPGAGRPLP